MILGFGAMLGKLMADSGAAQRIATSMLHLFGISRVQLAMVLTAFAIGITMFYEVGFVLLIPLVFTIVRESNLRCCGSACRCPSPCRRCTASCPRTPVRPRSPAPSTPAWV